MSKHHFDYLDRDAYLASIATIELKIFEDVFRLVG